MLPNAGFTGVKALQYSGEHTADGHGYAYDKVYDVDVDVTTDTELSYEIFPELTSRTSLPQHLRRGRPRVQRRHLPQRPARRRPARRRLSPQGQGARRCSTPTSGTTSSRASATSPPARRSTASSSATTTPAARRRSTAGSTTSRSRPPRPAARARTCPTGPSPRAAPTPRAASRAATTSRRPPCRTASTSGRRRPTRARRAGSTSTSARTTPTTCRRSQAFWLSHEPSPWMGDRQTFQVMPSTAAGTPDADRGARALAFSHDDEVARPYYYGVTFENGLKGEIAPTDHAALLRFSFPGDDASLIFDNVDDSGARSSTSRPRRSAAGPTRAAAPRRHAHVHLRHLRPADDGVRHAARQPPGHRLRAVRHRAGTRRDDARRHLAHLARPGKRNLALEVGRPTRFDAVKARAQRAVGREARRRRGRRARPTTSARRCTRASTASTSIRTRRSRTPARRRARSTSTPCSRRRPIRRQHADADRRAGRRGKVYVNNGFWDTYRTAWPAYSLLYPKDAGEMVDGFVQQYRDGGWVARWSSPGYANLMTGTSSDVAFADAYVKGVKGFDAADAYDAALKNATVAPPGSNPFDTDVGRKGLIQSIFLGYTPNEVPEGLSWGLEGYINDYGIGNMAGALADRASSRTDRSATARSPRTSSAAPRATCASSTRRRLLPGQVGVGAMDDAARPVRSARVAPGRRLHRDRRLELRLPRAAGRPRAGRPLRRARRSSRPSSTSSSRPPRRRSSRAPTAARSTRCSRRATCAWDSGARATRSRTTSPTCTTSPASRRSAGDHPRGAAPALRRQRDRAGLSRRRGQRRDSAWYVFSALGFYPLQVGSPNYAIGSPLFTRASSTARRRRHRRQRSAEQRGQRVRAACASTGATGAGRTSRRTTSPTAHARLRHGLSPRRGSRRRRGAAVADQGRRLPRSR